MTAWSCHSNPNPSSKNRIKKINQKENREMLSPLSSFLTDHKRIQQEVSAVFLYYLYKSLIVSASNK